MFVSFGMAEHLNGECVLRFDDTNPEAEKQEYIDHIQDSVAWMGWKPSKASTHSTLSAYACKLCMHKQRLVCTCGWKPSRASAHCTLSLCACKLCMHKQRLVCTCGWKPSKASTHSTLPLCACTVLHLVHTMCLMRTIQKLFCVQKFDVR